MVPNASLRVRMIASSKIRITLFIEDSEAEGADKPETSTNHRLRLTRRVAPVPRLPLEDRD
jgi:hypothetical protein